MSKIWYLSPSCQSSNIGVEDYGSEMEQMYLLAYEITPHLDRAGVSFHVPERTETLSQRCAASNQMGTGFHLALHSNAGGEGRARGPVAFYYSDSGKVLAEKLIQALLSLGQESNRSTHVIQNKTLYELRKTNAPAVLLEVDFHDSESGAAFITEHRGDIARQIAKVIIEADGKEFVPETAGEQLRRAVHMGLFPANTDWTSPLSKGEAAALAVALLDQSGKEVT